MIFIVLTDRIFNKTEPVQMRNVVLTICIERTPESMLAIKAYKVGEKNESSTDKSLTEKWMWSGETEASE